MLRVALTLLVCLAWSPAFAEVALTRTPVGAVTAPVQVGTFAAAPFAIDTGSARCSVEAGAALAFGLPLTGRQTIRDEVLVPYIVIDGNRIGPLRCALTADFGGDAVRGSIGIDVLSRYAAEIDLKRMTLSLHGGAQHGQALVSPRARLVDAERLPGGVLSVPVRFNSATGTGIVATGARRSVVNTRFAAASGAGEEASRPGAAVRGAFDLAGTVTPAIEGRIADLPGFVTYGLRDQPAMILGLDRLEELKLVIDYPRRRIWFDPG